MRTSPDTTSTGAERPRTPAIGSVIEGWRRVLQAPSISAGVFVLTLLVSLPLAMALRGMLAEHLGSSLEATSAATGWNQSWAGEFAQQAQGLGRTFTHEILGFGGTVSIMSGLLDGRALNPAIAGAVAAYLTLWMFLSGGILDRYARGRPVRVAAFCAACGIHAGRFIRLGVIMLATYGALFAYVHPFLFDRVYPRLVRDVSSEYLAVAWRLTLYALFGLILIVCNIVFDYAKVRTVVEDRRSMLGAIGAGIRFARRRASRVAGVYLLNALVFLIIVRFWYEVAPRASMPIWMAFLITQIYLVLRLLTKLAFMASEVVFFQGELAHAGYVARPVPKWPESASEEAIRNLS